MRKVNIIKVNLSGVWFKYLKHHFFLKRMKVGYFIVTFIYYKKQTPQMRLLRLSQTSKNGKVFSEQIEKCVL